MKPPAWATPLAGALIAGGRSSRFGASKAELPWAGGSLAAYLLGQMRQAGLQPLIYNAGEALEDLPETARRVADRSPGQGPLGGLATVLGEVRMPVLVAACDMPGLDAAAFGALAGQWRPGMRGLVARGSDGWHPLLGVYDPCLLPEIERRLEAGRKAMHGLVEDLGLDAWAPEARWVVNVNTPEQWKEWKSA